MILSLSYILKISFSSFSFYFPLFEVVRFSYPLYSFFFVPLSSCKIFDVSSNIVSIRVFFVYCVNLTNVLFSNHFLCKLCRSRPNSLGHSLSLFMTLLVLTLWLWLGFGPSLSVLLRQWLRVILNLGSFSVEGCPRFQYCLTSVTVYHRSIPPCDRVWIPKQDKYLNWVLV